MIQRDLGLTKFPADQLSKEWTSAIYAFFQPRPIVQVVNDRRCHEFICGAPHCKGKGAKGRNVHQFLDMGDVRSTSNLHKHAKMCWGAELVEQADGTKDIMGIRAGLTNTKMIDGSIVASF
jgi:hypothetical protein